MSFADLYQQELARLREQGRELATSHPDLARHLTEPGSDPDVERLLEGFAFLTASLNARLDDAFPELSLGLLEMLAPQLRRPVPSLTIMQFAVLPHTLGQPQKLERGCEVASKEIKGIRCRFRTCRDLWLYPANSHCYLSSPTSLTLELELLQPSSLPALALDRLQLHVGGELRDGCELYFWLNKKLAKMEIEAGHLRLPLTASSLRPAGFSPDEALQPEPMGTFDGERLLREYFGFPAGFLFLHLQDLPQMQDETPIERLLLHFEFQESLPSHLHIGEQSLQLNCVPAINLFPHDAEPIHRRAGQNEYPLHCSYRDPDAFEIYSVEHIEGWKRTGPVVTHPMSRHEYLPFVRFRHQQLTGQSYYRHRTRQTADGQALHHDLCFCDASPLEGPANTETISISLLCSNRHLAGQLQPGDICVATGSSPAYAKFRNLGKPSRAQDPVPDDESHWLLLNQLAHQSLSRLDKDRLLLLLNHYAFAAHPDPYEQTRIRLRLAAIVGLTTKPVEKSWRGAPIRGLCSQLTIKGPLFGTAGEIFLFGSILAHTFAQYVSINAFHELEILMTDSHEVYRWPALDGEHPLL